jgi:hypothetical protein
MFSVPLESTAGFKNRECGLAIYTTKTHGTYPQLGTFPADIGNQ